MPCCSVSVRRASARPRRVSDAIRSRNVALSRSMYAVLITPSPCARRLSVSTRAGVPATMRRSTSTTTPLGIALHDLGHAEVAPGAQPRAPMCTRTHRIAKRLTNRPDIGAQPIGTEQQGAVRRTAAHALHEPSNQRHVTACSLTSPASHKRVRTIMASAIHTMPPWVLTRISSACTCPRSRGCSTRYSCTACPWTPARAPTRPPSARRSQTR